MRLARTFTIFCRYYIIEAACCLRHILADYVFFGTIVLLTLGEKLFFSGSLINDKPDPTIRNHGAKRESERRGAGQKA